MKKYLIALLLVLPALGKAQEARIAIDVRRTVAEIDPKIYGVFMEPIHFNGRRLGLPDTVNFNTMYGNLYDPSSPLADQDGFRKDYIEAMKELKIADMRWPGGNYVMGYNWQDGIGPRDRRPSRINLAWGGTDNNHVGTDEWIQLNKSIGSENVVCVNLGLGTIQDAANWVEYCNYSKGTWFSDQRAKNGHAAPYGVKLWDLGNEVDGSPWELGHKEADEYVRIAREAAKAMRAVDNNIRFVASGSSWYEPTGQWVEWNRKVLTGLGDLIDYISIHRYWENAPDYYSFVGQSAMDFEEKINVTADEIGAIRAMKGFKNPIAISVDEWGSFGRNFQSILAVAQCLNSFVRHADVVRMANFTMLTSLLASDPAKGTYKSPLFYTFKQFSVNCRGSAVDAYVSCDTFNTEKYKGIPYLDVTAVYSKDGHTAYINVVNRQKDKPIMTTIEATGGAFGGKAEATIVNAADIAKPFAYANRQEYVPVTASVENKDGKLVYTFPAHSFTQIKVNIEEK